MKESKRVGLTVRFSFESGNVTSDVYPTVATAANILSLYPMIDELELMTDENYNYWEPPMNKSAFQELLEPLFGKDVMQEKLSSLGFYTNVAKLIANVGHNIKAMQAIKDSLLQPKGVKGCLGLYVTVSKYLEFSYHLLRTYASDFDYAVLPAHGSRSSAQHIPYAKMTKEEWGKTMVYSWIEFDGIMYLQQNSISGAVLKRIRFDFGDVPYDDVPLLENIIDAPPAPISFE